MPTATQDPPSPADPAEPKPVVVALKGATKAYGPNKALTDVDLELRAGEVMCLAGENGAGKSTLIKILTGAITRDSGDYHVDGATSAPRRARRRPRGRDRRRLPGAQPAPRPVGRREPHDEPAAARCAGSRRRGELRTPRARCSSASSSADATRTRSSSDAAAGPAAARRDREGARRDAARADLRRADDGAVGDRDERAAREDQPSCATRATRSCTSAITSRRCSRSATA